MLNVGGGKGTSVLDLIKSFEDVYGSEIKFKYLPRRDGDLAAFWADSLLAFKKMNWRSKRNIKKICDDTWRWHEYNPFGYGK